MNGRNRGSSAASGRGKHRSTKASGRHQIKVNGKIRRGIRVSKSKPSQLQTNGGVRANLSMEKRKLNILIVTPVYPPFVSVGGGVAITVSYHCLYPLSFYELSNFMFSFKQNKLFIDENNITTLYCSFDHIPDICY